MRGYDLLLFWKEHTELDNVSHPRTIRILLIMLIMSYVPDHSHDRFRAWKDDLPLQLSGEDWQDAC